MKKNFLKKNRFGILKNCWKKKGSNTAKEMKIRKNHKLNNKRKK